MTRLRATTRDEAVARAKSMCGDAGAKIVYRLADHQGGRDPFAADPASHWRTPIVRMAVASADCAGFVAWCLGYDRFQPQTFPLYGGWINCDSALQDARGSRTWFEELVMLGDTLRDQRPLPGDLVVFPSIDVDHDGARDRVGHIGVITVVSPRWEPGAFAELRVAHCSMGNQRRMGRAIAETSGVVWSQADRFRLERHQRWAATIIRFRRFVPPDAKR